MRLPEPSGSARLPEHAPTQQQLRSAQKSMNSAQEEMTRASTEAGQKKADRDARRRELFAWLGTEEIPLEAAQEEIVRSGTAARAEQTRLRQEKARLEASRTRLEALEKRELPQLVSQLDQAAREEKLAAEERVRLTGELAAAQEGADKLRAGLEHPGQKEAQAEIRRWEEELESLRQAAESARARLETARTERTACLSRIQTLEQQLAGSDPEELPRLLEGQKQLREQTAALTDPEGGMCRTAARQPPGRRGLQEAQCRPGGSRTGAGLGGSAQRYRFGHHHRQGKGDARDLCADDDL